MGAKVANAFAVLLAFTATTAAHDGGFGHSRRTLAVWADERGWTIEYRLTPNADEALLELTQADRDGDGRVSSDEREAYFAQRSRELLRGLRTDAKAPLEPAGWQLGPALSQTFVYRLSQPERELLLSDLNFPHKPGVVRVVTGAGVKAEVREGGDLHHAERVALRFTRTAGR